MRTQEEIVNKIKQQQKELISFHLEVLVFYLDFKHAKEFLKEDVKDEDWEKDKQKYTREIVLEEAKTYMANYGWPKCQGHRGISASRTLDKMKAWAWLLGDDSAVDEINRLEAHNYAQYGAPVLKYICERYGWPIPDDEATRRMMNGLPCVPDCSEGCGK
jgi:hypothetical protein